MSDEFVNLHTHTHASRFDGLGTSAQFLERIGQIGQRAVSFTEHGNLCGLYEQHKACLGAGVKLIPGLEAYLADDATRKGLTEDEKTELKHQFDDAALAREAVKEAQRLRKERDHITIWALNREGLQNLYRLSSWSWNTGHHHKPRIDMQRLREFGAGLAVSTGCPGGVVTSPLRKGQHREALSRARELSEIFGDRLYVEIMPHVMRDTPDLASQMVKLASRLGARVIATQDAHYPRRDDCLAQEVLLAINTRDHMSRPPRHDDCGEGRFCFDSSDYYLRSRIEMREALLAVPGLDAATVDRALDETMALSERVNVSLADPGLDPDKVQKGLLTHQGHYLVAPDLPEGIENYDRWLMKIALEGVRTRMGMAARDLPEVYRDRLKMELGRIRSKGFSAYMVAIWDMINWARSRDIMVGPGRGSAGGSLVCYLTGIVELDPIRYGLSFDRFLPESRRDLPDVDTDFDFRHRSDVIHYFQDKYGADRVALIGTHNCFGGKQALKSVGRAYEIPPQDIAPVTGLVVTAIEQEQQDDASLADVLENSAQGRWFSAQYPDVVEVAKRIEGQIASVGVHAAGVVVASQPLDSIVPLESRVRDDGTRMATIAWPMEAVESAGLVKLDALGLTTLAWLAEAKRFAAHLMEQHLLGVEIEYEQIPLDDPATLQGFCDNLFVGVFQFDTPSSRRLCRGFQFKRFEDVCVMTALNRPGPTKSGLAQMFLDRAKDPTLIPQQHPAVEAATSETLGCIVYQEQVVEIAQTLAGYSASDADAFRKKISKKIGLSDEEVKFVDGARHRGMDYADAQTLFNEIKEFAAYCFNKSHAYSYGLLSYWTMWAKVHNATATLAGILVNESRPERQIRIASEARRLGVKMRPPDVCGSEARFSVYVGPSGEPEVVGSCLDLKGVGAAASAAIAAARPFGSLEDFVQRVPRKAVNAKTFQILASATAFRSLCQNSRYLAENAKSVLSQIQSGRPLQIPEGVPEWTEAELVQSATSVYPLFVGQTGLSTYELDERLARDTIAWPVFDVGDPELEQQQAAVVYGRMTATKLFQEAEGRSGRVALTSFDGDELVLRLDPEVVERCQATIAKTGNHCVALIRIWNGRASADGVWRVGDLQESRDPLLRWLASPGRTKPAALSAAVAKLHPEDEITFTGLVARVRRHRDKKGDEMATLGIMGRTGYVQALVFSRVAQNVDFRTVRVGAMLRFSAKKLDSGTVSILTPPSAL